MDMIQRTKPNKSKISEVDLMELLSINTYGHSSVVKVKMITEALYKEHGLIEKWNKGNKTAGVKARKVFQLVREFSKDARQEIGDLNKEIHEKNSEKYFERELKKKEVVDVE